MKKNQPKLSMDRPSEARKAGASSATKAAARLSEGVQRLTLDFPLDVHRQLKVKAAETGRSMLELVLDAVQKTYRL